MERGRRHSLCLGLALGIMLALQGCSALSSDSSNFHLVPGTNSNGASALAINSDGHFPGHIAFVRNHELYIFSGQDGTVSKLPAGDNVQDPAYSPDGSRLAYIRLGAAWSDLMVMPAAKDGKPVALTHHQGTGQQTTCPNGISQTDMVYAANPIWALDGSAIYYLSDAQKLLKDSCGFQDMAVWKIPARGGKAQLVLWPERGDDNNGLPGAGGDANLSLRPGSGNQLAYTHYAYDPKQDASKLVQIFLAALNPPQEPTPDHQQETALTPAVSENGTPQQALEAAWSPDGKFLAYIIRASGNSLLAVMPVSDPASGAPDFGDYANTTVLLDGTLSYPVWSPDGKSLLYLEFKNNEYNLYLAPLTVNGTTISLQGSPIQLTQGGIDGDSRPAWTSA